MSDLWQKVCGYHAEVEGFELLCINGKVSMDGQMHYPHEDCEGTGLRYQGLSEVCPRKCIPVLPEYVGTDALSVCKTCKGHLRVRKQGAEYEQSFWPILIGLPEVDCIVVWWDEAYYVDAQRDDDSVLLHGYGDTLEAALEQALVQA